MSYRLHGLRLSQSKDQEGVWVLHKHPKHRGSITEGDFGEWDRITQGMLDGHRVIFDRVGFVPLPNGTGFLFSPRNTKQGDEVYLTDATTIANWIRSVVTFPIRLW